MPSSELLTPWSARLSLSDTIECLQTSSEIVGISYLGSTGTDRWSEASDYDLLLILRDYPSAFGVEDTIIDERIADVVIVSADRAVGVGSASADETSSGAATSSGSVIEDESLLDPSVVTEGEWPYVGWLAQSRQVYDPTGVGARAQGRAAELLPHRPAPSESQHAGFRSFLTHDLRVNRTLLRRCDDPIARAALGMRQLHTFVSAVQAWFSIRGLPSEGWKKNMQRLSTEDPGTFALVQEWLGTSDVETRHVIFEKVLDSALAPVGGTLPEGMVLGDSNKLWTSLESDI